MFNKNLVILIGLLIILSVLFERFKTPIPLLKEPFSNEAGVTNADFDPEPKYNSDKTSYVDYSSDYSNFTLKLSNGFFKLKNTDDAFTSYNGKITIQFTQNDYREAPFDTQENIINCFRKWQYFKYNGDTYRMTIPEDETEVIVSGNNADISYKTNGNGNGNTNNNVRKSQMEELIQEAEETGEQISPENTFNAMTVGGTCVPTEAVANDPGASLVCSNLGVLGKEKCNDSIGDDGVQVCEWIEDEGFQNKNNTIEHFQNDIITLTFEFQSVVENQAIEFQDELVLSELTFYTGPYGNTNTFTDDTAADFASGLVGDLGNVNSGVPCGWHYDEDDGEVVASGYFSEILNDKEWQKDNPELYTSLSKFICPSYLPVCTGQRSSGIVAGKCITLRDDCNNSVVDNMMGLPPRTYEPTTITDPDEVKYTNVISKNIANKEALNSTINKLTYVLDEPTIETFENAEDSETTCKFHIENKCYDQYVEVDKNYYDTGANIFNNIFPSTDPNVFKNTCYGVNHWISKNIVYLLFYKLIVGGIAALFYWSVNPSLDFQIRVFKSFIAFVFCEIYLLYNVYKHILKPTFMKRTPIMV